MQNTVVSSTTRLSRSGIIWLKLAVVYLIGGVALGIAMGATENFLLRPVHAHLNLLGWATLALAGMIYTVFPEAGESRLAKVHFWMHNLALPVMMASLTFLLLGHTQIIPLLVGAEMTAAGGVLVFACNIFMNLKTTPTRASMVPLQVQPSA
jgi:hypothetical protein